MRLGALVGIALAAATPLLAGDPVDDLIAASIEELAGQLAKAERAGWPEGVAKVEGKPVLQTVIVNKTTTNFDAGKVAIELSEALAGKKLSFKSREPKEDDPVDDAGRPLALPDMLVLEAELLDLAPKQLGLAIRVSANGTILARTITGKPGPLYEALLKKLPGELAAQAKKGWPEGKKRPRVQVGRVLNETIGRVDLAEAVARLEHELFEAGLDVVAHVAEGVAPMGTLDLDMMAKLILSSSRTDDTTHYETRLLLVELRKGKTVLEVVGAAETKR